MVPKTEIWHYLTSTRKSVNFQVFHPRTKKGTNLSSSCDVPRSYFHDLLWVNLNCFSDNVIFIAKSIIILTTTLHYFVTVSISFYHTSDAIPSVAWIPNAHYSGVFGLLKLTLPQRLPIGLHQVIVLDTDLTFLSDIAELWSLFVKMKAPEVLTLIIIIQLNLSTFLIQCILLRSIFRVNIYLFY